MSVTSPTGSKRGSFAEDMSEVSMIGATKMQPDDSESFNDLGHLSAAVGHHVINAFSAVVSNAEMIRSRCTLGGANQTEFQALATSIVEASLGASQVARHLIDWTRRLTAIETQPPGSAPQWVEHQSTHPGGRRLAASQQPFEGRVAPRSRAGSCDYRRSFPAPLDVRSSHSQRLRGLAGRLGPCHLHHACGPAKLAGDRSRRLRMRDEPGNNQARDRAVLFHQVGP